MFSRIRRWWHLRRTAPDAADTTVVVILLPQPPRPAGSEPYRPGATRVRFGADEQHARAVLLTALGEHPAPGGDPR